MYPGERGNSGGETGGREETVLGMYYMREAYIKRGKKERNLFQNNAVINKKCVLAAVPSSSHKPRPFCHHSSGQILNRPVRLSFTTTAL